LLSRQAVFSVCGARARTHRNQGDHGKEVPAHGLDSMWQQKIVPRTTLKGLNPSGSARMISTR